MDNTGILCVVLVAVVVSERKSPSNDHSSNTEIGNHNVERFKRNSEKKHHKKSHNTEHHKKHQKHHQHHKAKNGTSTDGKDSIYDNKKVDVNKKAEVVGGKKQGSKAVKLVKVKESKGGSNAGVIVAVIVSLIAALGIGAAVYVIRKKKQSKESE